MDQGGSGGGGVVRGEPVLGRSPAINVSLRLWQGEASGVNTLQRNLFKVISAIVGIDDFPSFGEDSAIRYGLLNYVAKFSLAKDSYAITPSAKALLAHQGLLTQRGLRRGAKSSRRGFTYEHPIPASVIADAVIRARQSPEKMKEILSRSDFVTIVTAEEDGLLRGRLKAKMPCGWTFSDSPYARYVAVGIGDGSAFEEIPVYGAIAR